MERNKPKNLLFVCWANENRSPTAAIVYSKMLQERGYRVYDIFERTRDYDYYLTSAGVQTSKGSNQMFLGLDKQMDEIFALDIIIRDALIHTFLVPEEKIYTLNIPDAFKANQPELIELLRQRLENYLPPRKK